VAARARTARVRSADGATGWYAGRLTEQHRRRTPAEATAFFGSIGLSGDFWRAP